VSDTFCFPPSVIEVEEDDLPMTMQVAMVGRDGIILASDTRVTTFWRGPRYGEIRDPYSGPKILVSPEGTLAVSCAQDMDMASEVARKIISDWRPEESRAKLKQLVTDLGGAAPFECIVANLVPRPQIARFAYISAVRGAAMSLSEANATDKLCAGDQASPAKFWPLRYYDSSRPVEDLIPLAAQLIVDAAHFNSGSVGGLYIVTTRCGRFENLSESECTALEVEAKERSGAIGNLIFASHNKDGAIRIP
jgi:hypothetical protein